MCKTFVEIYCKDHILLHVFNYMSKTNFRGNTDYTFSVISMKQCESAETNCNIVYIIRFRAASRQLRSCGRNLLHDDRTNLAFTDRAFSHAAPAVWNSLPLDIVSDLSCLATFKRLVKTELYNRAYIPSLIRDHPHFLNDVNVRRQPRNNNN